jgi:hypothetical protein
MDDNLVFEKVTQPYVLLVTIQCMKPKQIELIACPIPIQTLGAKKLHNVHRLDRRRKFKVCLHV